MRCGWGEPQQRQGEGQELGGQSTSGAGEMSGAQPSLPREDPCVRPQERDNPACGKD